MAFTELDALRWQFELTWRLAQHHLPKLTDEACLWEPAPGSWSVRPAADGRWRPDWSEGEPDPAPPTTIGWLTWHLIWWWSSVLAAARDEAIPPREQVTWPGSAAAAVSRLQDLSAQWSALLGRLEARDLERPLAYPWAEKRPLRLALAWANAELMKNIAEIGYARHLYEASRRLPSPDEGRGWGWGAKRN